MSDDDLDDVELDEEDMAALAKYEKELEGGDEEDVELDEADLEELRKFEQQLEEEDLGDLEEELEEEEERLLDRETGGNMIIGALQGRIPLLLKMEEEVEQEKRVKPHGTQKYLVNPFALKNYQDYEVIFDEINPEEPQMKIWRIEEFEPIPVPRERWGEFHSEDCYLILYITDSDENLMQNIHHWIGMKATPDKYGAVAFRAVELNTYLGGTCRIFRELENLESETFLNYFQDDLQYLFGGTPCAFHHVEPVSRYSNAPSYLYQLIPRANSQYVMQIVELSKDSLDSKYVFILLFQNRIMQWNGCNTSKIMRHHGGKVANSINNLERNGGASYIHIDEGEEDDEFLYEMNLFWDLLGGRKPYGTELPAERIPKRFLYIGDVVSASVIGSWDNWENPIPMEKCEEDEWDIDVPLLPGTYMYQYQIKTNYGIVHTCDEVRPKKMVPIKGNVNVVKAILNIDHNFKLYGTYSEGGKFNFQMIDYDVLVSSLLSPNHSYILDCQNELFLWFGRRCKPLERDVAFVLAKKIMLFPRPSFAPLVVLQETAENASFISKFIEWTPRSFCKNTIKRRKRVSFHYRSIMNLAELIHNSERPASKMIDDGSGKVEVGLYGEGANFEKLPESSRGLFYSESCYIVLYKYLSEDKKSFHFYCYFWIGITSTHHYSFGKFCLDFVANLVSRVGEEKVHSEKIYQGKETRHFLQIFGGKVVVRNGSQTTYCRFTKPQISMYDVRTTTSTVDYPRSLAVEVEPSIKNLRSRRCFVVTTSDKYYVWYGEFTDTEDRKTALNIAKFIQRTVAYPTEESKKLVEVTEDSNSEELKNFWAILGADSEERHYDKRRVVTSRMFCFSNTEGQLEITELFDFEQFDLLDHDRDVLFLLTKNQMFMWKGSQVSPSLVTLCCKAADDWIDYLGFEKPVLVDQHNIPDNFKDEFHAWNDNWALYKDQIEVKRYSIVTSLTKAVQKLYEINMIHDFIDEKLSLLEKSASSYQYARIEKRKFFAQSPKVDFTRELIMAGVLKETLPKPKTPYQSLIESVDPEKDVLFHWKDSDCLAVSVLGSWDGWADHPLYNLSADGFGIKLQIPPGRYHYKYRVATEDGVSIDCDSERLVTSINTGTDPKHNVLRVYKKYVPSEEKVVVEVPQEEVPLTVEEIARRDRELRERLRQQQEERLRNQIEELRRLRGRKTSADTTSTTETSTSRRGRDRDSSTPDTQIESTETEAERRRRERREQRERELSATLEKETEKPRERSIEISSSISSGSYSSDRLRSSRDLSSSLSSAIDPLDSIRDRRKERERERQLEREREEEAEKQRARERELARKKREQERERERELERQKEIEREKARRDRERERIKLTSQFLDSDKPSESYSSRRTSTDHSSDNNSYKSSKAYTKTLIDSLPTRLSGTIDTSGYSSKSSNYHSSSSSNNSDYSPSYKSSSSLSNSGNLLSSISSSPTSSTSARDELFGSRDRRKRSTDIDDVISIPPRKTKTDSLDTSSYSSKYDSSKYDNISSSSYSSKYDSSKYDSTKYDTPLVSKTYDVSSITSKSSYTPSYSSNASNNNNNNSSSVDLDDILKSTKRAGRRNTNNNDDISSTESSSSSSSSSRSRRTRGSDLLSKLDAL